jgi:BlaI family transcriptional regulator, penicillinase repressor
MPRPASDQPTPAELEVLKVFWERGPSTVRQVMETLNPRRERAYTSVMSLLNVMTEKGLLTRLPQGRAFIYEAAVAREQTLGQAVEDLLGRVFEGSASSLVAHLFDQSEISDEELVTIRRTIREYNRRQQSGEGS